ncbi:response regulator [Brevundimonas sp. NPDC092305]|uniref:response regulator n=1 Tax=Brevundimonas sp. NPDC092305 TaxID=3363957 RepID=UPI00381CDC4B
MDAELSDATAALFRSWDQLRRPIWMFDPWSREGVYANPAALTLWGAESREELLARDFSNLSAAVVARTERLMRATADGSELSERWTFYPNGAPVTVQATISSFALEDGRIVLLFEAAPADVEAEERRAVEALRHTSTPITLFDADGRRLFANPAAHAAYGDVEGGFVDHFADRDDGETLLAAALSGGSSGGMREMMTDEGLRWHHVDARTVLDPVTGATGVLLNEQDVTQRVVAETARATAEQTAAMFDARQRFLTEMSHELRTPLNAVLGFSELLTQADLEPAQQDQSRRIHEAGQRLSLLVESMIAEEAVPVASVETMSETVRADDAATDEISALQVLYVDDNDSNRALVTTILSVQGIICATADDGRQGLEMARSQVWDLILMDIQMPVMDGVEATRAIRALPGAAGRTPIVAVTANTLPEQLVEYAEAGMDDVLGKPVNILGLLEKVDFWSRPRESDEIGDVEAVCAA